MRGSGQFSELREFKQAQVNTYSLGIQAVGIVANMLTSWHIDATEQRVPMVISACLL